MEESSILLISYIPSSELEYSRTLDENMIEIIAGTIATRDVICYY